MEEQHSELGGLHVSAKELLVETYGKVCQLEGIVRNGLSKRVEGIEIDLKAARQELQGHLTGCPVSRQIREHLKDHDRAEGSLSRTDRIRNWITIAAILSPWLILAAQWIGGRP